MNTSLFWILIGVSALWLLGALATLWRKATHISLSLAFLASLIAAGFGAITWLGNLHWEPVVIHLDLWKGLDESSLPPLHLVFGLDALAAFFMFLVSAFAALVAVYSFRALQAQHLQPYAHRVASAFSLFSWTTVLVITAQDGFSLLVALELMTLSFGYLALYKHFLYQDKPEYSVDEAAQRKARLAPQVYLMISHASTALLLLAVLLLSVSSNGLRYRDWIANVNNLDTGQMTVIFLLALAGLGIRCGLTPAHIWVPLVHPSSPTTTHALSLGIAIKVAIYLMYRFFFQFLTPQAWWGYLLLIVAVVTALVNVWYAISSHDLKEALAYHSVENIGIICVGIGLALVFWENNRALAFVGLVASLYHLLNHAVFKGLLYLATGAIDNLTHQTVDMERLGGLIHSYPFTASMFLIGSFAIAGFPPFNGFISEWLTLQAGLHSLSALADAAPGAAAITAFLVVLVSLLILVVSFALTAFCFYKMAGVALLGIPRLPEEERVNWEIHDVPVSMQGVMGLMAGLCLILGVLPGVIVPQLTKAFAPLGMSTRILERASWQSLHLLPRTADGATGVAQVPVMNLVVLSVLLVTCVSVIQRMFPAISRRPSSPWNCGEPVQQPPVHQFTGGALSYTLRKLLGLLNRSSPSAPDYIPSRMVLSESPIYPQQVVEVFRDSSNRLIDALLRSSRHSGDSIQNGDIRRYLRYVFWVNLIIFALYWLASLLLVGGRP